MAKIVDRPTPDFADQSYVVEAFKGVLLTSRQFMRNLFGRKEGKNLVERALGLDAGSVIGLNEVSTVHYPEDRRPYTARFRGRHRLMRRPDEQVRCVACMLCATACPANCITIVAAEHDDKNIEKYPTKFEIDLLKCIYCGFCEEACPCDAIRMDSGIHSVPTMARRDQKAGVIDLLSLGSPSVAEQGGEFRAHSHAGAGHGRTGGHH